MAGESRTTTDHDTIRRWAEARGGRPATVTDTKADDEAGILRIAFPDGGDEARLEPIDWPDFFEKFDREQLAFLYQDETKRGEPSRFFKFVSKERH